MKKRKKYLNSIPLRKHNESSIFTQSKLIFKLNQKQDMVERTVAFMPDGAAIEMAKINGVWTSIPNTVPLVVPPITPLAAPEVQVAEPVIASTFE